MSNEMTPTGDPGQQKNSSPVTAELFERFIENQSKEIVLRQQEFELGKQKDDHNFEFGKAALDAQERDRIHDRECRRNQYKDKYRLILWVVVAVVGLILGALYFGSEALALELAKAIILLSAGAAGGYGIGKSRKSQEEV